MNIEPDTILDKYRKMLSVLSAHQIALWEYDIETGAYECEGDYFEVLGMKDAGISFSNMEGFYETLHPDDVVFYREKFGRALRSVEDKPKITFRCVGKQGEVIWLENNFYSCRKDAEDRSQTLLGYTVNVTAAREREEHIRTLEDRNRKVIEALPEFIFIFDDNFFIVDVLMSQDTELLHPVEELIGIDGRTVYSPEVSDLFIRNIRQCLEDGQIKEIEYPLDKDGRYYFQARIAPFEGNKVLALIHDIGDRVRRSQELIDAKARAEEADRMKSIFMATMSHEIRTPLNAIVGFSELIASGDCGDEQEEYLEIIKKNSNLLLQLVNDVLDLSRIESGKSEIRFERVDVAGMFDEIGKVHQMKMPDGVVLSVLPPETRVSLSTDRNRVTQVLFNFLSNAIKNTAGGTITLGAGLRDGWVELFVRDTGCGIPEDKLPVIFDRFEKLNDFVQGTGLGLSICRGIAERLGGHIDVKSTVGGGSTFTLCLPSLPQGQEEILVWSKGTTQVRKAATDRRKVILVAEDVEANFKLLQALLKNDYVLRWATNGQEAIHSFVRERPDLILMDIKMPVMNGIEATERIRGISPDIPIIAVTAHAFYTEEQQALAAGCNAIVSKPYTAADLKQKIAVWLDSSPGGIAVS